MGRLLALFCLLALAAAEDYSDNESVKLFQEYLQINTTTNNDFTPAVKFWQTQAEALGVEFNKYEYVEGYPVLVLKWAGANSSLESIMLNSHIDVVPADNDDGWTYPPFSGTLDTDGVIWGRGTQDMKSVSIQYFEALKSLKANNVSLLRDVYMTLMPDEEIGGYFGMVEFLNSSEFEAMDIGVELDEGTAFNLPLSPVFYQDKVPWQIQVDCYGVSAHGSTFPETSNTATGKCADVINTFFAYREEEYAKEQVADITNAGSYTSVNLNKINAGTANNIIPSHVTLVFDIRLNITVEETAMDSMLQEMVASSGENITMTYLLQGPQSPATRVSSDNPYWTTFYSVATAAGYGILPVVPPGATDARYVRDAGYPAFGFSPMPNTELLLHSVNERLSASTFLKGIELYKQLITALANISGDLTNNEPGAYVYSTVETS